MTFLAPYMLLGAVAAGVPIALHFFYRSRYRTVPWAAMKFLLRSIEQTSRRLRFQELLLLCLRVLVLLVLAIALARPSTRAAPRADGANPGDAVDAVFVIDTSYSMAARDGPGNRLDRAKTAALAVLDHLPPDSTVQIISSSDRAALLGPRSPSEIGRARQLIQELAVSALATDVLPGITEAASALRRGHAPNRELYVFSDMQRSGWQQQAALAAKFQEIARETSIYLVRCGAHAPRNVAVVGIVPQAGIPHTGERVDFAVLVRNTGKEIAHDLTVSLEIDDRPNDRDSQPIAELAPGETRPVTLTARLDRPGLRVVSATVKSDELEPDNRFDQVVHVRDQVRILVVDGASNDREPEKSASFYLVHSLRPVREQAWGGYHIQPRIATTAQAVPALLADKDLCILVDVSLVGHDAAGPLSSEFIERLAGFVKDGRGLMVFAGPQVQRSHEAYNRLMFDRHGLMPARLGMPAVVAPDEPLRPDPTSIEVHSFLAAFREEPLDRIRHVEVLGALGVDERASAAGEAARVVLRYSSGQPAVLTRKIGDGEVMLVTTSADQSWTDWPLRPTYLPFLHVCLGRLLQEQVGRHNRTAGQTLNWPLGSRDAARPFAVIRPDNVQIRLDPPELRDGRPALTVADTSQAGVYRIVRRVTSLADDPSAEAEKIEEPEGVPFAVVPDLRESEDLEALTDGQLGERLGVPVIHLTAGDDPQAFSGAERLNRERTKMVLAVVLLLALAESVLAWICGRAW